MFSGIIETMGELVARREEGTNVHFTFHAPLASELHVDQSLSHNGVCLTVVELLEGNRYVVTAIEETLIKSNLGDLKVGDRVNLERSMRMDGRLDGHIVQGHVDQTATCIQMEEHDGSYLFTFQYEPLPGMITVEKGSISVNGVSLTVVNSRKGQFSVAIIPYTFTHTNFGDFKVGTRVNLEFDILGKYIAALMDSHYSTKP